MNGLASLLGITMCSASCLGCAHGQHRSPPPVASGTQATPSTRHGVVEGDVFADAPAVGRLVVGWRTADEQREFEAGNESFATVRRMMDRWTIGEVVDFSATSRIRYRISDAPQDATAVVVLDVAHDFWPTLSGEGRGKMGASKPGGGDITLVSNPPAPDAGERCVGDRYRRVVVPATSLPASDVRLGDVGTPGARRFCAWLPPSSASHSGRRYPVIYLLPGFLSSEMEYLGGRKGAAARLDKISAELGREAVLVSVDTSTPLGSTYLEDSPVTGAWDSFFSTRALPELERSLPVLATRTARALVGHSTGGFNALSYGLRHPELFSVIGASSPDAPDMEAWLVEPPDGRPSAPRRVREWIRRWTMFEAELGGPGQMTSYAADWAASASPVSPDRVGRDGRLFVPSWPFDLASGRIDESVLARWVARTPRGLLRDRLRATRLASAFSGRVFISVGRHDEFDLFDPAARFANALDAAGVKTTFAPVEGGHDGALDRIEAGMRFALERLDSGR